MRNFLEKKNIVGAMMVSRCGDILHHTIPALLKWTDRIIIMLDNEDRKTRRIVENYKKQYSKRVEIFDSNVRNSLGGKWTKDAHETRVRGLFKRFNTIQGEIREVMLQHILGLIKGGEKIDIVMAPDSDELFSDHVEVILKQLAGQDDKKAVIMKPVDVFGDMFTVRQECMQHLHHIRDYVTYIQLKKNRR